MPAGPFNPAASRFPQFEIQNPDFSRVVGLGVHQPSDPTAALISEFIRLGILGIGWELEQRALSDRVNAAIRTAAGGPGTLVPLPLQRLATTATFPAGVSAQVPVLAGSRFDRNLTGPLGQPGDPFGFARPTPPAGDDPFQRGAAQIQAILRGLADNEQRRIAGRILWAGV